MKVIILNLTLLSIATDQWKWMERRDEQERWVVEQRCSLTSWVPSETAGETTVAEIDCQSSAQATTTKS